MKIHLLSDLHTEAYGLPGLDGFLQRLIAPADVCVLAGDIGTYRTYDYVLEFMSEQYENVIYVPGNHEYYGSSLAKFNPTLPKNVKLLNPGFQKIGDVTFLGATLWTNFGNDYFAELIAKKVVRDFTVIQGFTPHTAINLYHNQFNFLQQGINTIGGKKVVVTHFSPSMSMLSEYWKENGGVVNKYFHNDLDSFLESIDEPITWLFGHTHDAIEKQINNVSLHSNPYGYPGENKQYKTKVIEV